MDNVTRQTKYYICTSGYGYSDTYIYLDKAKWHEGISMYSRDAKDSIEVGTCLTSEDDGWYRNNDRRPDEYTVLDMQVLESQEVSPWRVDYDEETGVWMSDDGESYDTEDEAEASCDPVQYLTI